MQTSLHDVVIVGARAAGAATAVLLARAGLDVVVVDRTDYGTDTLSTHALMRGGVLQLQRWGLLDRVVAAGTPPVRRATFRYAGEDVTIQVKPSAGVDALYAPRRTVLDPVLVEAAAHAGADIRHRFAVTGLARDHTGRVGGVDGRDAGGRTKRISARFVVGADGIRSTVARQVGAPIERLGTGASATTYGYWSGLVTDGYEWNFRPDAASGVIPTNDGLACVFASATPRRIGRGGPAVIVDVIGETFPDLGARLGAAEAPPAFRTFAGQPGHIRRSWGDGWALVGDAGYWKDPLSVHGITDALRDAELLARALLAVFTEAADEPTALGDYQRRRDELSSELFDVVDVIAGHRWTDAEIPQLLLRLSAAMADEVEALAALPPILPDSLVHRSGVNAPMMRRAVHQ
jgi:2-polyprenyl-6-methoxyphenol hydroxylase-like FAD-dependent oxidoreductase